MKLKEYIRKIYNRLLRKKPRREIWGRQFDGYADIPAGKQSPKNKKMPLRLGNTTLTWED